MNKLPRSLQTKPFTYQEARACDLTQYALTKLVEDGTIERVGRGVYRSTGDDVSDEELYRRATKVVGEPAVVCLLSALSDYGLTDIIPKQVWLMVPAKKRAKSALVKLYRARVPNWDVGINRQTGYSITSIERTIVDALTLTSVISRRIGIEALKRAILDRDTTPTKILDMSTALGVKHRILPYIETVS